MFGDNRGQAHTLEGVLAAFLLVFALVISLNIIAVTPLTASTTSQHIENQNQQKVSGLLKSTSETGELTNMVLYWDDKNETYHNTGEFSAYNTPPNNKFGNLLQQSFTDKQYGLNMHIYYDNSKERKQIINMGDPTDNAVTATTQHVIYDKDMMINKDGTERETVANDSTFYIQNEDSNSIVYSVITVEISVWVI